MIRHPKKYFDIANDYALDNYTCCKVQVGSLFITEDGSEMYVTCNQNKDHNCREMGFCYKARESGIYESREETRHLCKAVHSEINMINLLKSKNIKPGEGVLFVTRYPCQACLKACIKFGIKNIFFAGYSKGTSPEELFDIAKKSKIVIKHFDKIDYEYN